MPGGGGRWWAGRPRTRRRSRPLCLPARSRTVLWDALGAGAHEYELMVDAERGFLLRAEARFDDRPFKVLELTEVLVDADVPAGLFTPVAPEGESSSTSRLCAPSHSRTCPARSPSRCSCRRAIRDGPRQRRCGTPSHGGRPVLDRGLLRRAEAWRRAGQCVAARVGRPSASTAPPKRGMAASRGVHGGNRREEWAVTLLTST